MSVVNKMLNDLEKRSTANTNASDYVPSANGQNNNVVIVLVVMLLILGILLVWLTAREPTALRMPSEDKPRIVEVNTDTQLDRSAAANNRPNNVSLTGQIKSSQLQASAIQPGNIVAGDVEIVLDGETMDELVNRLKTPVAQTQALGPNKNSAVEPIIPASDGQAGQISPDIIAKAKQSIDAPDLEASGQGSLQSKPDTNQDTSVKTDNSENNSSMSVSTNSGQSASIDRLQREANSALQAGNKDTAIEKLNALIKLDPRDLRSRKKLSSLLFAQGKTAQASTLLDTGIKLAPTDSSMRLMQARLLFRAGNVDQALTLLKQHPNDVIADDELLSFRAALADKQSDYAQSMLDYKSLLERQPEVARWWLGLGVSQDKQGFKQEAKASYRNVKGLNQLSDQVLSFVEQRLAALEG